MAKATAHEVHVQTVAHIQREAAAVGAEIRERTERRVAIYNQRPPGAGPPETPSSDLAAAHAFALERANGNAPASMRLMAASMDSDHQLAIEIAGLQIYAEVLQRQDMAARAAEAYQRSMVLVQIGCRLQQASKWGRFTRPQAPHSRQRAYFYL
jgi:hypothetical protein